jgi:hypothetical protein
MAKTIKILSKINNIIASSSIKYFLGAVNVVADALSRPAHNPETSI